MCTSLSLQILDGVPNVYDERDGLAQATEDIQSYSLHKISREDPDKKFIFSLPLSMTQGLPVNGAVRF